MHPRHFFTRIAILASVVAMPVVATPADVDSIELNGRAVWRTAEVPKELHGRYLYEKQGEPIIELHPDGTGVFQAHGVAGIPIKYWLLADEGGHPVKEAAGDNYRYSIVIQYGPGAEEITPKAVMTPGNGHGLPMRAAPTYLANVSSAAEAGPLALFGDVPDGPPARDLHSRVWRESGVGFSTGSPDALRG